MTLLPRDARLRAAATSALGRAAFRLGDSAIRAVIYDHPGKALWVIGQAEKHLRIAKAALRAWQRGRQ